MKLLPHPNVQITTLSVMGLDQSFYFRCRAKLHLAPFFAVTVCIVQTNKLFPFVNHPGNPQLSVLCSCIMLSAVTRTEQSRGCSGFAPSQKPEEKRTVQRGRESEDERETCSWQPSAIRNESHQLHKASQCYLLGTSP